MRFSPFDKPLADSNWLDKAPLYGRVGLANPREQFSYEVFPVHSHEDTSDYQKIPRDIEKYADQELEFDILDANSGTEYVSIVSNTDRPRIRWYSRSEHKNKFLYDPLKPPRPRKVTPSDWEQFAEDRVKGRVDTVIRMNKDRTKLLQRIARLWNGDVVCGVHVLADACPSIKHVTTDLNERTLKELYYDTTLGRSALLAFGDAEWFGFTTRTLKSTSLFRKQVWYDLNDNARRLIYRDPSSPDLNGDPYEGLVHRVTVGLVRLHDELRGWNSTSYFSRNGYVIDIFGRDTEQRAYAREVITAHNNWQLYRDTYKKMKSLDDRGVRPIAIFDSRETAYDVFNHWHRAGLCELPNGPFNSDFSVANGRKQIQEAYRDEQRNWKVADWTTTWKLKQRTLGPDGPELDRQQLISLSW